jgi:hypothetical protein
MQAIYPGRPRRDQKTSLPGAATGEAHRMPTEPEPVTLSAVVHRAVEAVDPDGGEGLGDLLQRFEDDDQPLGPATASQAELRIAEETGKLDPQQEDAAVTMASAVATYLVYRRDALNTEPAELLALAARAEFDGVPPEPVASWLGERGVTV